MTSGSGNSHRKSKSPLDFTDDHARHYNLLAENHRREGGPWPLLARQVQDAVTKKNDFHNNRHSLLVVDLASGPGEPAATIAKLNVESNLRVLSTDLSEDMVRKATTVAAGIDTMLPPIVANMEDLDGLHDDSADIVTCCYGYMFPPDKLAALRETARILKPGGILLATTFNAVPFFEIPKQIKRHLDLPQPPKGDQHPMSLAQPGKLEELVTQAGLKVERTSSHRYDWRMGESPDELFRAVMFRSRSELDHVEGSWDEARGIFDRIYRDHFEERGKGGGFWAKQLPEYKLLVARKPK